MHIVFIEPRFPANQKLFIRALAEVKKAAALANIDTGRLSRGPGDAIVAAADEILAGQWRERVLRKRDERP